MDIIHFAPRWEGPASPFRHTWEGLANIDQFRWLVRRDTQEQLKLARDELGCVHVRAVGMFDDEMRVLGPDPASYAQGDQAGPRVNWQLVDYVIDSLVDLGIAPMYTTCFMPGAMAAGDRTVFTTKSRISPPKDWGAWESLVREGVAHAIGRYGVAAVREWYFEVWNEPNLKNGFWEGGLEEYLELWRTTYRAIKSVDPALRVGGPSSARGEWIGELLDFAEANGCVPDYIISHIYNNDSPFAALSPFDGPQEDRASTSPHFAAGVIRGVRKMLDSRGYRGPVHWNEWGASWRPHAPERETSNEAAFVVKTMAEVSQAADLFAYWNLSDIYDQVGYGAEAFHGHYGMLNLQGLRKPVWFGFLLLGRLGKERIEVEGGSEDGLTGAIATRTEGGGCAVAIYDYRPTMDGFGSPYQARVRLPPSGGGIRLDRLRLFRVDDERQNVLAAWRALGAPAYLSREQTEDLRRTNSLRAESPDSVRIERGPDGDIAVFRALRGGVALLEID